MEYFVSEYAIMYKCIVDFSTIKYPVMQKLSLNRAVGSKDPGTACGFLADFDNCFAIGANCCLQDG